MKKLTILILTVFITTVSVAYKEISSLTLKSDPIKTTVALPVIPNSIKEEIPIVAWVGVPQDKGTLARYQEMRATGITQSYVPFSDAAAMETALDLAQEAGIKLFVSCPELISAPEITVKRFMNHPALAGYYLKDEPGRKEFPALGELVNKIQGIDKQHLCYVNLLPTYADENQLGAKSYQEYLDAFTKEVPVQILSFDHYPVIGKTNKSIREDWYKNLELVAERAKKSDKPFWAFALTTAFSPYPLPTLATLRLQVYSDLAYGAQGIQYFTYWTLTDPSIGFNNAPITPDGKQTVVYQQVQQMSKEIKDLSSVFFGAKMIAIAHTGDSIPLGTKLFTKLPKPIRLLKTDGIGAVISILKKSGKTFLVVVNRDFTAPMNLRIKCTGGVSRVLKNGTSIPQQLTVNKVKVGPGDIAIYTWLNYLN